MSPSMQCVLKALHLWVGLSSPRSLGGPSKANSVVLQLVFVVVQAYKEWKIISSFTPSSDSREEKWPLVDVPLERSSPSQARSLMVNPEMYKVNTCICPHSDLVWKEQIRLEGKLRWKMEFPCSWLPSITSAVRVEKGRWCWLPPPSLQSAGPCR